MILILLFITQAFGQAPDFLHPQQKGPFQVNGIAYLELDAYTDNVQVAGVPPIDQIIQEIKATNTNLVKITINMNVKNATDNFYDPSQPFPFNGKASDIQAFGQKLTAQGIPCYMQPFSGVENIVAGAGGSDRVNPTDRRAFMLQHIPRLVSLAQLAEGMGCEYYGVFGDEIEHLVIDPKLTDLWLQAISQIRAVFSGRLTSTSSWGEKGGPYTFGHQPQIIGMLDAFGIGFFPSYTDHADPTVTELVASFQRNSVGHNSLLAVTDMHTLYQKPIFVTDEAYGSFVGSNVQSDGVLFGQNPASQFTVDYQEQVNLYAAFFQAMSTLDANWMVGVIMDSFDRFPYSWKDTHLPPYLGSLGESFRGKPALQTLTQAYQTGQAVTTPANGWWYNPAMPGVLYPMDSENGIVRLGILGFSTQGDPQWSLARSALTATGTYVGTAEQYVGGRALNQPPQQPEGVTDGSAVQIVFTSATTGRLQIGNQSFPIQRYQFSNQWASPMLNPTRAGWWDEPNQSGRGYFLEAQGNTLLVGGLIYSPLGASSWFTATGPVDSTGRFSTNLTVCSAAGSSSSPVCLATKDTIQVTFKSPWDATLTLGQESPVEIRRYRQSEIGWAGPTPSFSLSNPAFLGEAGVVNATSQAIGAAPGSIATISGTGLTRGVSGTLQAAPGPLPFAIGGTSVLVNGMPAPMISILNANGQEQVTFQVPWEAQGTSIPGWVSPFGPSTTRPTVSIVVVNNGSLSSAMQALFFDAQPAMITSDGSHVVAVHSDNSPVTAQNPAHQGEVITMYGTAFGRVTPSPGNGIPASNSAPSTMDSTPVVSINALNATVQFAGLSSGFTGQYELRFVVPDGVGTGDVPVSILVAGQTSIVSLAVQGQPGVQSELIRNGTFSAPIPGSWFLFVGPSAAATVNQDPSSGYDGSFAAHISITATGVATGGAPAYSNVSFGQFPIPLTQGVLYQFQFWARAGSARNVPFGVFKFGGGPMYGGNATFSIGTGWQHFVTYFQANQTGPDAQVILFLGDQTGDVWFESVSLQALSAPVNHFTFADHAGSSVVSTGTASSVTVGYGVVQPVAGSVSPSGVAIFDFRQNNILVSEAGVPASPAVLSGRIYAEANGPVNTGLAVANPSNHPALVSFYFTDANGNNLGNGSVSIPANGQIANFLNESPFNIPSPFSGTFTFSASVPVAAIALRGFTNERNEFLITTLPIADLSGERTTQPFVFPHFADGGGWTTQIVLVNPTDSVLAGTVQFHNRSGQNAGVTVGNQVNGSFAYSLPPRSSQKFETAGGASSTTTGSVRVVPTAGSAAPSGLAIFSFRNGAITVSQAGVPAMAASTAFRLYAETAGNPSQVAGLIETGVAIANNSPASATVTLQLFNLNGTAVGTGTLSIPANGQAASFVNQIPGLTSAPSPFQGMLRVTSDASISVVGLRGRYNERSDFLITTTPASDENAAVSFSALYFPHLVDGAGYTTQLILFSNTPAIMYPTTPSQATSVDIRLYKQDGTPLILALKAQ